MSNSQLYLLIACALTVYIGFAFAILYLKRRLRMNKSMGMTIIFPIFFSFALGVTMLILALG